jgi:hypothetical protein
LAYTIRQNICHLFNCSSVASVKDKNSENNTGRNDGMLLSTLYECLGGHTSFSKDLSLCGVKGCNKEIVMISTLGIDWFYEINEDRFCIYRHDLSPHEILEDPNITIKNTQEIDIAISTFSFFVLVIFEGSCPKRLCFMPLFKIIKNLLSVVSSLKVLLVKPFQND